MARRPSRLVPVLVASVLAAGCQAATEPLVEPDPLFDRSPAASVPEAEFDEAVLQGLTARVDALNAELARSGAPYRLDYPWMFVVGQGVDPYMRLRTGGRWQIDSPSFILDASDYTADLPAGSVESALLASFGAWNDLDQTYIRTQRTADPGTNLDVLDGTFLPDGTCADVFDYTSPNLDLTRGLILPEADIVMGGWLPPAYFVECLGSASILGVTWTFSIPDTDGDQYRDILYVEQFYNDAFRWVDSGSSFLVPPTGVDVQSIATHENGHALGLDHFGGPLEKQPFTLKPDGRVYNPEAVMNPFYLYGEKRHPLATDRAALRTLYGSPVR